jgi:uncharacterized membrane protein YhaH (DUF805 family)
MSLSWLFFSFQGRVNRSIWWLVIGGTLFLDLGVYLATANWEDPTFSLVVGLVALALRIAPSIKRLHDRNKSGSWLWLYFGLPQLVVVLAAFSPVGDPTVGFLGLVVIALLIAVIVDLGALPGTQGDNRFGPDPLAGRPPGGSRI